MLIYRTSDIYPQEIVNESSNYFLKVQTVFTINQGKIL